VIEFLIPLILEIVEQLVFEVVVGMGFDAVANAFAPGLEARPSLMGVGYFLMGLLSGIISLIVFRGRLMGPSIVPGLSLIVAPIVTGAVMAWTGAMWRRRGGAPPAVFTFRAGAIFAFGMALVRFLYVRLA
jgi:hypothetical protein